MGSAQGGAVACIGSGRCLHDAQLRMFYTGAGPALKILWRPAQDGLRTAALDKGAGRLL